MDSGLDLASVSRVTAAGCFVNFGVNGDNVAVSILITTDSLDNICALETYFVTREETEVFLLRYFHKVFFLDPELT